MALLPCRVRERSVSRTDVRRLLALRTGGDVEADALAFGQGLETLSLDRGEMREKIVATAFRSDETEALGVVEPLYGTCCHVLNILKNEGTCPEVRAKLKTAR
ncbi:hypothetical protein ebA1872 [Aromatoleum aromaticum EbN1]|uniref:Uncharacterized protein n=1 Tax=Aromatoleum aromaticum (strain DSM 19018 / LMG 30748 / EbN1) TaxID=76114 RepID=Q5P6B9_AROAE|nr:hypothetical protein ebA1872 [Aromatoleum aromaticum EbN1]